MKLKKVVPAVIVLLTAFMSAASAASFTDTRGHWAEDVINTLAEADVVHGVSDTAFNPDGTVTRAEFFKMALGAAGIDDVPYRSGECLDVTASEWYGGCIQSALDKGLVPEHMIGGYVSSVIEENGESRARYSGYLSAETPITREEMAYIAQSVYQYWLGEDNADNMEEAVDMPFTDLSSISRWAFDGVRYAYAQDFVAGMDDGTFSPRQTATRAQAAVIVNNLLTKMK